MNDFLKNNKLLNWGIFALVSIVVLYLIGARAGKAANKDKKQGELDREIRNSDLTYEPTQYASFADTLYTAMTGLTDDENAIYSIISKMRSRSDVLQLISAFGTQRIHFTLGNSNLNTWLGYRLSNSEIAKINKILQESSVDYQF